MGDVHGLKKSFVLKFSVADRERDFKASLGPKHNTGVGIVTNHILLGPFINH